MAVVRQASLRNTTRSVAKSCRCASTWASFCARSRSGGFVRFEALFDPGMGCRGWSFISWPCSNWGGKNDPHHADRAV